MRYVVTGARDLIGSNTVDELVSRGESVVVLDDLSAGKEDNLAEVPQQISFIKGSINELEAVRRAMHEADYVLQPSRAHLRSPLDKQILLNHRITSKAL